MIRRNCETKSAALPDDAVDLNRSSMHFHQFLGDCKSQADALRFFSARLRHLIKLIKNFVSLVGRDPRPRIADYRPKPGITRCVHAYDHSPEFWRELYGVANQIRQHLRDLIAVRPRNSESLIGDDFASNELLLGHRLECIDHLVD